MKLQITKSLTLAAIGLVLTTVSSPGASYTWDGGGGNGNWSTGANWTGDAAPTGTGHILTFSGSSQTASTNNGQLSVVHGISFAAGAAAFTLSGSNLTLAGDIINSGTATQTIGINLQMATTRIIDTRYGNITVSGNISNDGTNRLLQKEGLGVLELSGSNAWGGRTNLRGGTLLLSGTTPNLVSNELWLGQYDDGNNSVFAVKGGDLTYSGTLASLNRGANVIRAETGVDITFAQASAFTVGTWGTLNFDVSGSNSSIAFSTTAPGLTAGRILQATVTGTNGKTSFAAVDTGAGNKIIALTGLTDISTNPATTTNTNGSLTGGNYNNTQTDRNLNSLTLSGTGGTVTGNNLRPREILMQEGTGNYTFDVRVNPSTASYYLFVHQYSTSGTLTFNAPLLSDDATGGFAKTGLGTVLISASSTSTFTGPSSVQLGTLRVNGALSKVSALDVYEDATLDGSGSIGSAGNLTDARVRAGGTLGATSAAALTFTGSLTLDADSAFSFTLGAGSDYVNVSGAVTLASNAILQLALSGTPAFDTPLYLIRSGTSITGSFVYNGATMSDGATFSLGGYDFTYRQDADDIWVTAVPEPSVAVLAGLGAVALLLLRRRTRLM